VKSLTCIREISVSSVCRSRKDHGPFARKKASEAAKRLWYNRQELIKSYSSYLNLDPGCRHECR
jgi:hypothetical protein